MPYLATRERRPRVIRGFLLRDVPALVLLDSRDADLDALADASSHAEGRRILRDHAGILDALEGREATGQVGDDAA